MYYLHQEVFDLTFDKTKLCDLTLNLLACRRSSPSYPVFLWEHYYLFQLREVYENMCYLASFTRTFLEFFWSCYFDDKNLLCELFLHNMMCEYVSINMVETILYFMGDSQLRVFPSFMRNQIKWKLSKKTIETNEERKTLWVWAEPRMSYEI